MKVNSASLYHIFTVLLVQNGAIQGLERNAGKKIEMGSRRVKWQKNVGLEAFFIK